MPKTALITGITGQDGAILAHLLLQKGYDVHGLREYMAVPDTERIEDLEGLQLHYGDLSDGGNLKRLIDHIAPDEIYNMAAQSHVGVSFEIPEHTANINALGTLRLLEAIRDSNIRFYQASSSEMFGRAPSPQHELTPFEPCSPYGTAKLFAYWSVRNYRQAYGLHASNGILFNHESALRGEEFVTRKITKAVGRIEAGLQDKVLLGNLDAQRDWGHARDYMECVWKILQQTYPDDYVLATGQARSVRDFVETAFAYIGTTIIWRGEGAAEQGIDKHTGKVLVDIDPTLFRPQDIHVLIGDATKARTQLGWTPKISFKDLVAEMIETDRIVSNIQKAYGT